MEIKKHLKSKTARRKKANRPSIVPTLYRDLKPLRRRTKLFDPLDFAEYLEVRLLKLKPETVLAIAKCHRMRHPDTDPEIVSLWLAETIFEKRAWK